MSKKDVGAGKGKSIKKQNKSERIDTDSAEELADALDVKDPEQRAKLIRSVSRFTASPVPPPQILEGYDDVVDGGAKWLLEYTKDEQAHRHKMDEKELKYYSNGQIFGFILGLIGIGGGIYLAATGAKWFGFGAFIASLVSLVGLFVYNKQIESKENR